MGERTATGPAPIQPGPAAIATFVDVVFSFLEGTVAVRIFPEKGDSRVGDKKFTRLPFLTTGLDLAAQIAAHAREAAKNKMALYAIPGTTRGHGRAKNEGILGVQTVLIDLDTGDIAAKRDHLVKRLGPPTLEVESGGVTPDGQAKLHLYWKLTEPAGGAYLTEAVNLRHVIALKAGGDVSFQKPAQLIRIPGSIYYKNGTAKIVAVRDYRPALEYELRDLSRLVAEMPAMPGVDAAKAQNATRKSIDEIFGMPVHEGGADGVTRFDALSQIIGHWVARARDKKVTLKEAWSKVRDYNQEFMKPPWDEIRLRKEFTSIKELDDKNHGIAGNGVTGGPGQGWSAVISPRNSEDFLALTFADKHGEDSRYVAAWGKWLEWTDDRWRQENTLKVFDLARKICRVAASACLIPGEAKNLAKSKTVAAVEQLSRSDRRIAATKDQWDLDEFFFNPEKERE
jgi:putative DNA primase/helicase